MANVQPVAEAPHPLRGAQLATQTIIIGDYEVGREIGRGSFATVYKGHHIATRVPVAVKSVQRSKLTKKLLESLESEIAILKAVRHEHIVELVDCKKAESHIHLVMEFCSLGDLSNYIKKKGDIPGIGHYPNAPPVGNPAGGLKEYVARHFLKQLACALKFLREQNLVHRDIKPQNLLLLPAPFIHSSQSPHDRVMACLPYLKLADFGFARFLPSHSLAETLCGSPLYMAPEILRYEKYDATADLWSVGAVLFEMVVAKPPFRAQNHVELLRRIERSNDKIRFPGEEKYDSHAQYRRKSSELAMATSPRQNSVQRPAHPESIRCGAGYISEEMKGLIRRLLRRNPVERASFEEFFSHVCVVGDIGFPREAHARGNLETDIGYISTSSPATTGVLRRAVSTRSALPLPRRPPDDTNVGAFVSDLGPEGLRDDTPLEQRPTVQWRRFSAVSSLGRVRSGAARAPIVKSALTNSPFSTRVDAPEPRAWGMDAEPSPRTQGTRRSSAVDSLAGGQIERRVSSTQPSNFNQHFRRAPSLTPVVPWEEELDQLGPPSGKGGAGRPSRSAPYGGDDFADDLEKDYVVVEKRVVEVNALADALATSPKVGDPTPQPFRVSPYNRSFSPPGSPMFSTSAPTCPLPRPRQDHQSHPGGSRGMPHSLGVLSITPPFATNVPSSSARARPSTLLVRSQSNPLIPSPVRRSSGWTTSAATSVLAKAISTASARLFCSPSSSSPGGLSVAAAAATGFGRYSSPFMISDVSQPANAVVLFEGAVDPDEGKTLKAIEEYAKRAYVIFQFAEARDASSFVASDAPKSLLADQSGTAASATPSNPSAALTTSPPANVAAAAEALVLYVKALSVFQMAIEEAKAYWTGASGNGTSRKLPTIRLSNAVQWTRDCFNECLIKAERVKSRCTGVKQTPKMCAEKLIYDRAAEISRAAAVNELVGEDLLGCEVAYCTALLMMRTLSEGPFEDGQQMDEGDQLVIAKFISSIDVRLNALRQRLAMLASRSSSGADLPGTATNSQASAGFRTSGR